MQKLKQLSSLNSVKLPYYVTSLENVIVGTNRNLRLTVDTVLLVKGADTNYDTITIQHTDGDTITSMLGRFRLAYKNEVKKCKS